MTFDDYMTENRQVLESRRQTFHLSEADIDRMMERYRIVWKIMILMNTLAKDGKLETLAEVVKLVNAGKLDEAERLAVGE